MRSSDSRGASTEDLRPVPPKIRSEKACDKAVEALWMQVQHFHEHDQRIIFSLISVGLDTMVDEIRRMRRHPESMGITM